MKRRFGIDWERTGIWLAILAVSFMFWFSIWNELFNK
jgi:hypothetical protein